MTRNYTITYLSCQACSQRVHCEQCQEQIAEMLLRIRGVQSAQVNMAAKTMHIEFEGIDADDIEEILENAGVFVD